MFGSPLKIVFAMWQEEQAKQRGFIIFAVLMLALVVIAGRMQ